MDFCKRIQMRSYVLPVTLSMENFQLPPVSAIVFDLDGVLANSIAIVEEAWQLWSAYHGLDFPTVMSVMHGRRKTEILAIVSPHLDAVAEVDRLTQLEESRIAGVVPIPGANTFVDQVPAGQWAIATSGERRGALARLRQVGITAPAVIITAEDVHLGKPNPEPYLKAAQGLGIDPTRCLVFEDAPAGIQSARSAGMLAVAVLTTYPASEFPHAHYIIPDFTGASVQPYLETGRVETLSAVGKSAGTFCVTLPVAAHSVPR
jgi:mannitol-1-/sugar-/sorbitol-6-phosphatase